MTRAAAVAAVALVLTIRLWAQTAGTTHLTGRLTTPQGDVLPGVTVTLAGNGTTATAFTGPDGRFAIETSIDRSTIFTLRASLAGFQTVSRGGLRAGPGATVNVGDIQLPLGCLSNIDLVVTGLREEAARAATVAHLRIQSVQPLREWTFEKTCYTGSKVSAVVVNDLGGLRPGARIRFVPVRSPALPPYATGDEIVVALHRNPASRQYFSWGYGYGVRSGVVSLATAGPIDEFEAEVPVLVLFERLRESVGTRRRERTNGRP